MLFKTIAAASVAAFTFAGTAMADHKHHGKYGVGKQKIIVSCYRGPWKDVIWDRPNAVFIDSLVKIGYDFPTAQAIGSRVCRDEALVGNPEALKATMLRIWRQR
jgi:hypothetical protein